MGDTNKVRMISMFQKLQEGKVRILTSPGFTDLQLREAALGALLKEVKDKVDKNQYGLYSYRQGYPVHLALEVDGEIRVWRWGDAWVAARLRPLEDVTDSIPKKVVDGLKKTMRLIDLTMQKVGLMKQLASAIIHKHLLEVPDDGRVTGCDSQGEQAWLPEGGTEGAVSPCPHQV